MKRFSVNELARLLFKKGVIPQPEFAERHHHVLRAHYSVNRPQFVVTDGATRQHLEASKPGVMKYKVVDDPTFALIVAYNEARVRWVITSVYFFHPHRLRANKLMHQLRLFPGVDLPHGELEKLFAAALHHDKRHNH